MSATSTTALLLERVARDPAAALFAIPDSFGGWFDLSAAEFLERVRSLAKGFLDAGLERGDRIGVLSSHRFEVSLVDFAAGMIGVAVVPLTRDASQEELLAVLDDAGVRAVIVETARDFARFDELHGDLPSVDDVWQIALNGLDKLALTGRGSASDVELDARVGDVDAETLLAQYYFDDADGVLRRITVSHGIALARAGALADVLGGGAGSGADASAGPQADASAGFGADASAGPQADASAGFGAHAGDAGGARDGPDARADTRADASAGREGGDTGGAPRSTLLVLPAGDVVSRITTLVAVALGARIGHLSDPAALLPTLASFRPTLLVAQPEIYEEIDRAARERAQAAGRGAALRQALDVARDYADALDRESVPRGLRTRFAVADALVLRGLRKAAGGRLVDAVSIATERSLSSPLRTVMRALDARPLEAYGLPETTGIAVIERRDDPFGRPVGGIGSPLPGVTASLSDDGGLLLAGAGVGSATPVAVTAAGRGSGVRGRVTGGTEGGSGGSGSSSRDDGTGHNGGAGQRASATTATQVVATGRSAEIDETGRIVLLDRETDSAASVVASADAAAPGGTKVGDSASS